MDYRAEILAHWAAQVAADRRERASWTWWLAWEDYLAYRNFPVFWQRGETHVWAAFLQMLRERPDHLRRFQEALGEGCYVYPDPETSEHRFCTDFHDAPRPDGIDELIELLERARWEERERSWSTIHLHWKPSRIHRAEWARESKREGHVPDPPDPEQRTQKGRSEIMYLEFKPDRVADRRAREKVSFEFGQIGRVYFSQTGKTLYYGGMSLQSRKGRGSDSNYADTNFGLKYWISRCRRDGRDSLIRGVIEIDDDVREEYWTVVRQRPDLASQSSFRSAGRNDKRKARG